MNNKTIKTTLGLLSLVLLIAPGTNLYCTKTTKNSAPAKPTKIAKVKKLTPAQTKSAAQQSTPPPPSIQTPPSTPPPVQPQLPSTPVNNPGVMNIVPEAQPTALPSTPVTMPSPITAATLILPSSIDSATQTTAAGLATTLITDAQAAGQLNSANSVINAINSFATAPANIQADVAALLTAAVTLMNDAQSIPGFAAMIVTMLQAYQSGSATVQTDMINLFNNVNQAITQAAQAAMAAVQAAQATQAAAAAIQAAQAAAFTAANSLPTGGDNSYRQMCPGGCSVSNNILTCTQCYGASSGPVTLDLINSSNCTGHTSKVSYQYGALICTP